MGLGLNADAMPTDGPATSLATATLIKVRSEDLELSSVLPRLRLADFIRAAAPAS